MLKTPLYRHQQKALTFLLEREQDKPSLKEARYKYQRLVEKRKKKEAKANADQENGEVNGKSEGSDPEEDVKAIEKPKGRKDSHYSLWESREDEKGRVRGWKNKITGVEVRGKHKPEECKGAILADDVSEKIVRLLTIRWVLERHYRSYRLLSLHVWRRDDGQICLWKLSMNPFPNLRAQMQRR